MSSVYPSTDALKKDLRDFMQHREGVGSPEYIDAQKRMEAFCSYLVAYEHGEADLDDLGLSNISQLSNVLFDLFLFMENRNDG